MTDPKALSFVADHWFPISPSMPIFQCGPVIEAVQRANDGKVPAELFDEGCIWAFANAASIPITDQNVEPGVAFPNRQYANRKWLRELWAKFLDFCLTNGVITTEDIQAAGEKQTITAADVGEVPAEILQDAAKPAKGKKEKAMA